MIYALLFIACHSFVVSACWSSTEWLLLVVLLVLLSFSHPSNLVLPHMYDVHVYVVNSLSLQFGTFKPTMWLLLDVNCYSEMLSHVQAPHICPDCLKCCGSLVLWPIALGTSVQPGWPTPSPTLWYSVIDKLSKLFYFSPFFRERIELATRGQGENGVWLLARKDKITVSIIGRVVNITPLTNPDSLIATITNCHTPWEKIWVNS